MFLQEVQNEHRNSAQSSPVIKLDSDDEAAQQPSSASALHKTRVLIVAQHVSLKPSYCLAPRVLHGTVHTMKALDSWLVVMPAVCAVRSQPGPAALRQMHRLLLQEITCQQVRQCMQAGASALLQKLFEDYLLMRLDTRQRARGKARSAPANGSTAELPVRFSFI